MIPDWATNCVFLPAMLGDRFPDLFNGLQQTLTSHGVEVRILQRVKDIWTRDYAPVQVGAAALVKFRYAPDYVRDYEYLQTQDSVPVTNPDDGQQHTLKRFNPSCSANFVYDLRLPCHDVAPDDALAIRSPMRLVREDIEK